MPTFREHGVREIIALSPHCMNTLRKEYGSLGIKVSHYSEALATMIADGSLKAHASYDKKVIYHDPCFLGKQNNIFDEPRSILKAIPGLEMLEFSRLRETSRSARGAAEGCLRGGRVIRKKQRSTGQRGDRTGG